MFTTTIISIAAFIGVATLVGGITMMFRGDKESDVEDRLDLLTSQKASSDRGDANSPELLNSPLDETRGMLEKIFSRFISLRTFLDQADAPMTPSNFLLISIGLLVGGCLAALVLRLPVAMAPLLGMGMATFPSIWLYMKRKRRLAAFGRQLPEALELISRALRAGHSLAAGIHLVAEEMAEPIRKEFGRCYEEQNFGIPLDDALDDMTRRVPNLDLRFFATAVILQRTTGGDLAEILDKIGHLVRERFKIWGQVQALTGEGRLSGIVLLALPPCLFLAMYNLNPDYSMILFEDPLGHKMLAAAIIMQVMGAFVIRKIINIKV